MAIQKEAAATAAFWNQIIPSTLNPWAKTEVMELQGLHQSDTRQVQIQFTQLSK